MGSKSQDEIPAPELSQSENFDLPEQIAEWTLEPELAYPPPRAVVPKMRFSGTWYWGIVLVLLSGLFLSWRLRGMAASDDDWKILGILFAIALVAYFVITSTRKTSKELVTRGIATRGTVVRIEKYTSLRDSSNNLRIRVWYNCVVAYDTPSRQYISYIEDLPKSQVGDTLTVLYLPDCPAAGELYTDCSYKAVPPGKSRRA